MLVLSMRRAERYVRIRAVGVRVFGMYFGGIGDGWLVVYTKKIWICKMNLCLILHTNVGMQWDVSERCCMRSLNPSSQNHAHRKENIQIIYIMRGDCVNRNRYP
jgi:hypothetical protein